jgi:hypothetical protein
MERRLRRALAAALVVLVAACASGVQRHESDDGTYAYSGQKFGKVSVTLADAVKNDPDKAARVYELRLDQRITNRLMAKYLYDANSEAAVNVVVENIRVRNAFNAIMFGFMAGADILEGTVTLTDSSGKVLNRFIVNASYALGGVGGGQDSARLDWLSDRFGVLTAETIVGKKPE